MLLRLCLGCLFIQRVHSQPQKEPTDMYVYQSSKSIFKKRERKRDEAHIMTLQNVDEFFTLIQKHPHILAIIHPGTSIADCDTCIDSQELIGWTGIEMRDVYPPVNMVRVYAGNREDEIRNRWDHQLPVMLLFRYGAPHYWYGMGGYPNKKEVPFSQVIVKWINEEIAEHPMHMQDWNTEEKFNMAKDSYQQAEGAPEYNAKDDPMSRKTKKLHVEEIAETWPITHCHECTVVGVFQNETHQNFKAMALKVDPVCTYHYTFNRMVPKRYGIKPPSVALTYIGPSGRKVTAIYGGKLADMDSLQEFVRAYRYPLVWRLEGPERFNSFYSDGRPALMLFCDRLNKCEREHIALKDAQMKLKRRLLGVLVDTELSWAPSMMAKAELQKSDAPVLVIAEEMSAKDNAKRVFKFTGDLTNKHAIIEWVQDYVKTNDPAKARNDL